MYFDVFEYLKSPEAWYSGYINKSIWCFTFAVSVYLLNYFQYVISPRTSQKITVERWYTVSPITVWLIILGHLFGIVFLIASLWSQYEILSLLISGLFVFASMNILKLIPL